MSRVRRPAVQLARGRKLRDYRSRRFAIVRDEQVTTVTPVALDCGGHFQVAAKCIN